MIEPLRIGGPPATKLPQRLDPMPTPSVGQGSFVVIGVENAGQKRFGRQMIGGVLSGRDPAAFTGCG